MGHSRSKGFRLNRRGLFLFCRGGNTGDALIQAGCLRFLKDLGMNVCPSDGRIEKAALLGKVDTIDELLGNFKAYLFFSGGGNIGIYEENERIRKTVIERAKEAKGILVFPQSCLRVEDCLLDRRLTVWARDRVSYDKLETAGVKTALVPDAALYLHDLFPRVSRGKGTFSILRREGHCLEKVEHPIRIEADKSEDITFEKGIFSVIKTLEPYEKIVSDRLHGTLIASMLGKQTGLLPVAYHKNQSFYETWLSAIEGISFIDGEEDMNEFFRSKETPNFNGKELFLSRASKSFAQFLLDSAKAF